MRRPAALGRDLGRSLRGQLGWGLGRGYVPTATAPKGLLSDGAPVAGWEHAGGPQLCRQEVGSGERGTATPTPGHGLRCAALPTIGLPSGSRHGAPAIHWDWGPALQPSRRTGQLVILVLPGPVRWSCCLWSSQRTDEEAETEPNGRSHKQQSRGLQGRLSCLWA